MKRIALFVLLGFAFPMLAFAQPQHFTFKANTGDSYSIVIDNATLDGNPLGTGDEIGVFTPARLCVGATVWTGTTPLALTAWVDDTQTPEVDGYVAGEAMSFKIWDASANAEYTAAPTYTLGNGNFGDGAYARLTLAAVSGAVESITVIAPNGGENWQVGTQQEIKWSSANFTGQVHIEYSTDGGTSFSTIIASTDDDGSYVWTIPNTPSQNCRVKISDAADGDPSDASDSDFSITSGPIGGVVIVDTTSDSGPGSLRDAILQANNNPGPDTIRFAIPKTDPGFDADVGVWTLQPVSALPVVSDEGLVIDGRSQAEFIGTGTNLNGPEIVLDGSNAGTSADGLSITAAGAEIYGLTINRFSGAGIFMRGVDSGRISGCYIGTDFAGSAAAGNIYGIFLLNGTQGVHIIPSDTLFNVISGNTSAGVFISDTSSHNVVLGNIIGLDRTASSIIGNSLHGICIQDKSDSNEVVDNRIGGNSLNGVYISESSGNLLANNLIGTNETWGMELGNQSDGVYITGDAQNNLVIENLVGHNGGHGVFVHGAQAIHNTITRNGIFLNGGVGIKNLSGGNGELAPPVITSVTATSVTGTAPPNATVEIFSDPEDEGSFYEGTAVADASSGNFTWTGTPTGPNVTATATDAAGNTSEFSTPVSTGVEDQTQAKIPQAFELFQNYPNPFNPETQIDFALPKSSQVTITIYNVLGQEIKILVDKTLQAGHYVTHWDGKDAYGKQVSGGTYFVRMRAGNFSALRKAVFLK